MSGFLDRILSGEYPKLESIWRAEFEKLVDEVFGKVDVKKFEVKPEDEVGGLEDEFVQIDPGMLADLDRLEGLLAEEKARHEATKRELHVTKSELKAARFQLDAVRSAMERTSKWHDEPVG